MGSSRGGTVESTSPGPRSRGTGPPEEPGSGGSGRRRRRESTGGRCSGPSGGSPRADSGHRDPETRRDRPDRPQRAVLRTAPSPGSPGPAPEPRDGRNTAPGDLRRCGRCDPLRPWDQTFFLRESYTSMKGSEEPEPTGRSRPSRPRRVDRAPTGGEDLPAPFSQPTSPIQGIGANPPGPCQRPLSLLRLARSPPRAAASSAFRAP